MYTIVPSSLVENHLHENVLPKGIHTREHRCFPLSRLFQQQHAPPSFVIHKVLYADTQRNAQDIYDCTSSFLAGKELNNLIDRHANDCNDNNNPCVLTKKLFK